MQVSDAIIREAYLIMGAATLGSVDIAYLWPFVVWNGDRCLAAFHAADHAGEIHVMSEHTLGWWAINHAHKHNDWYCVWSDFSRIEEIRAAWETMLPAWKRG